MAAHILKRLKGYRGKSGRHIYECTCRNTVEAWTLVEAQKIHRQDLKKPFTEMNELLDEEPVKTTGRQVYYNGYLYK